MEIPSENYQELRCYFTWFGEDGIIRTKVKPQAEITLEDAKENSIVVNSLVSDKKCPLIVDTTGIKSMEKQARDFFSLRDRDSVVDAIAIIRNSPIGNMIANFFIGLNKPAVPTRLFRNEEDAVEWCLEQNSMLDGRD